MAQPSAASASAAAKFTVFLNWLAIRAL